MEKFRIIPKLEVKSENVVKGMRMEGLRVVGQPSEMANIYLEGGADEILFIDTVASLYNRSQIHGLASSVANQTRVPLIVGGGLRSVEDINEMLQSGADKISINTAAHRDIKIISDASEAFGAQSVVASVQAKRRARMQWDSLYLNGRENSSTSVVDWCKTLVDGGVGEILLTSIDQDGTMMGPDKELIDTVLANVRIPVVVSGGVSSAEDVLWIAEAGASGVAIARCLHFKHFEIKDVKKYLKKNNVAVSWRY